MLEGGSNPGGLNILFGKVFLNDGLTPINLSYDL